jgi:hypothetical protein
MSVTVTAASDLESLRPAPGSSLPSPGERARLFFLEHIYSHICGLTFGEWLRLLWENRFAVDPPFWARAAFLTLTSAITSQDRWRESLLHGRKIAATEVPPPLFILGHWRGGTTHLHNLMVRDPQFGYPTLFQVFYPRVFIGSHWTYSQIAKIALTSHRIIDNVAHGIEQPNEDEFALMALTFMSPYMSWAFPRRREHYDRYLTLRGVPEAELRRWKEAFVSFLKKLTYYQRKPMVLKSPTHTCRIKLLLELFPEAKFVHIHRDPYAVFRSTRHLEATMSTTLRFQKAPPRDLDTLVIDRYREMYDAYFEEKGLIPPERFHEIRYEDLERDPLGQVAHLYEALGLPGFEAARPELEHYVASLSDYKKNEYADLPADLRQRVSTAWRRSFDVWGYPVR